MAIDESEILQYITENYSERKKPVSKDWTFREHFYFVPEELEELEEMLLDLFTRYNIKHDNFNIDDYFQPELPWWWFRLRREYKEKSYKTLTVEMIIESAKAGKWLYD
jgi:hypothetical protein